MAYTKKYINGSYYWRFDITYKDAAGQRKRKASKWYKTKTEAKKALEEFKKDTQNAIKSKEKITFKQAADAYIESIRDTNVRQVVKDKAFCIDTYFKPLHNKKIETITYAALKSTLENNSQFQALGSGRKNVCLSYLKEIFKFACDTYGLEINHAQRLKTYPKTNKEKSKEKNIWTPSQFDEFLKVIPNDKKVWADFFSFLFWTGCRLNEGLSLRWSDWDPDTHIIYFRFQYDNGEFRQLKTKNARRQIIIDDKTAAMLEELHQGQQQDKGYTDDWFIFSGSKSPSEGMTEKWFRGWRDKAVEIYDLPYVTIHGLRHSHISYLIFSGVDPYLIQKRVGHASYQTTMDIYGHLMGNRNDEILNVLNK